MKWGEVKWSKSYTQGNIEVFTLAEQFLMCSRRYTEEDKATVDRLENEVETKLLTAVGINLKPPTQDQSEDSLLTFYTYRDWC